MSGRSLGLHKPSGGRRRAGSLLAGAVGALVMAATLGLSAMSPASAASTTGVPQGAPVLKTHGHQVVGVAHGKHKLPKLLKPAIGRAANASFSSTNWDGYALTNNSDTNTTSFNSVSATWVQPAVTCNAGSSVGSTWVG